MQKKMKKIFFLSMIFISVFTVLSAEETKSIYTCKGQKASECFVLSTTVNLCFPAIDDLSSCEIN
jgi:hypothetical protein